MKNGFAPSHRRRLGKTELLISPLALGTVKIGRNTNVKYPRAFPLPDDREVRVLLETAMDLGINLVDTAPAYGVSEQRLGQLLPGSPDDWIVCTKAGEFYTDGQSSYDFSAKAIRSSVIQSLRNLQRDVIEIVLLHSNGDDSNIISNSDALMTLGKLKKQGHIKFVGMSTKTLEGAMLALPHVDILMVTLNEDDPSQIPVIAAAHNQDVGILLKKVLASGHSSDIGNSLAMALEHTGVHAAVVGTINPDHLRANVFGVIEAMEHAWHDTK